MSQAPGEPGTPAGEPPAVEEDGLPAQRDEQPAAAQVELPPSERALRVVAIG